MTKSILTAMCSVQFHLTEGQKVEAIYPDNALNKAEIAAVAFSSFPDSMSFELTARNSIRDTSFSFRIPRLPFETSTTITSPRKAPASSPEYLHGFVFCRQRQDERLQRGGEQRAIVVLSPFPLSNILKPLSQYSGPLCLAQGSNALRAVYEEVASWTPLLDENWGSSVDLPIGHAVLRVDLPDVSSLPLDCAHAMAQFTGASSAAEALAEELDLDTGCPLCLLPRAKGQQTPVAGLYTDSDIFTPFAGQMRHLWTLWEILLLGEPLLVAAPTPSACSEACTALASLLAPLPYCADYRPYFTINDAAFGPFASGAMPDTHNTQTSSLTEEKNTSSQKVLVVLPSLLGVTNPFIIKTLSHWPNTLSTGFTSLTNGGEDSTSTSTNNSTGDAKSYKGIRNQPARPHSSSATFNNGGHSSTSNGSSSSSSASGTGVFGSVLRRPSLPEMIRRRITGSHNAKAISLLTDPSDSAWLSYRPLLQPDNEILNNIVMPESGDGVARRKRLALMNSTILRRHFEELGRAVVFPLLPFITPTPPPKSEVAASSFSSCASFSPPPLLELDSAVFIQNVASGAVNVPEILVKRCGNGNRRILAEFYKRILEKSTAMAKWLEMRRHAARAFQTATWREAWRQAGGAFLLPGIQHTEDVGSIEAFLMTEAEVKLAAAGTGAAAGAVASSSNGNEHADSDKSILFNNLIEELRVKFNALPSDLQDSLLMNPERKALLEMQK